MLIRTRAYVQPKHQFAHLSFPFPLLFAAFFYVHLFGWATERFVVLLAVVVVVDIVVAVAADAVAYFMPTMALWVFSAIFYI